MSVGPADTSLHQCFGGHIGRPLGVGSKVFRRYQVVKLICGCLIAVCKLVENGFVEHAFADKAFNRYPARRSNDN